jgi:lipoprotein-releasing system permease protein
VPRIKAYKVAAIFKVDMYEYDSSCVYMSLAAAGTFFQTPGQATHIEVIAQDPETLQPLVNAIAQRLGPAYDVADWTRNNGSFFAAVEVERTVMFLILTLIIVVAAFNVVSGLIMLVKDKGRDIAILRTMGATRGMVMRIFFLTGASVGVMGTGLGVILGLVFSQNIEAIRLFIHRETGATIFDPSVYFLSHLPAKVDPHEVLMVVVMSLGLSLLATLYPAWRAARLDPVEALRYE